MKICYRSKKFSQEHLDIIQQANEIIDDYQTQGFDLTLRQLYYQFVARALIPNTEKSYKRMGGIISAGRMAGLIDWEAIEDRTRNLHAPGTWDGPSSIVRACARGFTLDGWENQEFRPEVWIEKEALFGVFDRICAELRVPLFACRGYTSQSEMWRAGRRLKEHLENDQEPFILHFGDHDPSGIDMSRDIEDRLGVFMEEPLSGFQRMALNIDQVQHYGPPPNPAKLSDSRAGDYVDRFGMESWELDALEPKVLTDLVRQKILAIRDDTLWQETLDLEREHRRKLKAVADNWEGVTKDL